MKEAAHMKPARVSALWSFEILPPQEVAASPECHSRPHGLFLLSVLICDSGTQWTGKRFTAGGGGRPFPNKLFFIFVEITCKF